MTRKPQSPNDGKGPGGTSSDFTNIPSGRRFSGNSDILDLEAELVADGVELPNRAIPVAYHAQNRDYTREEIEQLIETEVAKDAPNKQLIGYLNELKE